MHHDTSLQGRTACRTRLPSRLCLQLLLVLLAVTAQYAPRADAQSAINTQDYEIVSGNFGGSNTAALFIARDPARPSGIVELGFARSGGSLFTQSWPSNYLGLEWSPARYNFIAADVNGDKRSDLILQSKAAGDHYVLLAGVAGGFYAIHQTIPNNYFGLDWSGEQHRLVAGDYNGDGRDDLFFQATTTNGTNAILLADASTGLFTAASNACTSGGPHLCWSDSTSSFQGLKWSTPRAFVYAGDFNGDGKDDFVVQARPTTTLINSDIPIPVPTYKPFANGIILSQSSGTALQFSVGQYYDRFSLGVDWSPLNTQLVIARLGEDASDDIIFQARRTGKTSYVLRSNGNGTFAAAEALPNNLPGPDNSTLVLNYSADAVRILPGFFNPERLTQGLALIATTPGGNSTVVTQGLTTGAGYFAVPANFSGAGPGPGGSVPPGAGDVVGAIPGQADVSIAGEASYTIPLNLPPGINGLTPRLSLQYRHNAGGGLLGRHWDVGGLSQIDRCVPTLGQDGTAGSVQYVPSDRYCLDGNKLKLVSGSSGVANAVYRTELETYSRVTVRNSTTSGQIWFEVYGKDGLIYEFGNSVDSRITVLTNMSTGASATVTWALSKIRDRAGNYINYTYSNRFTNLGIAYPESITYTGNSTRGTTPAYTIVFARDTVLGGGGYPPSLEPLLPISPDTLLASIFVQANDTNVELRRYTFGYLSSGVGAPFRTLLSSVQECRSPDPSVPAGQVCLAPTTFSYANSNNGWRNDIETNTLSTAVSFVGLFGIPGEINGDGFEDLYHYDSNTSHWIALLGGPTGYVAAKDTGFSVANGRNVLATDFDGNGQLDLLIPNGSNFYWLRYQNSSDSFLFTDTTVPAIDTGISFPSNGMLDVDGDGYQDLVSLTTAKTQFQIRFHKRDGSPGFEPVTTVTAGGTVQGLKFGNPGSTLHRTMDLDGDGRNDLFAFVNNAWRVQYSTGSGYAIGDLLGPGVNNEPMDVNSDRCTDVLVGSNPRRVLVSKCRRENGSALVETQSPLKAGEAANPYIVDWDGDGVDDVVYAANGTLQWSRGRDGFLTVVQPTGINAPPTSFAVLTDLDGNGRVDLVFDGSNGAISFQRNVGGLAELMTRVVDGYGNVVTYDYRSETSTNCYRSNSAAPPVGFGLRNRPGGMYVACSMRLPDGRGNQYTLSYSYGDAKFSLRNRGLAGFATRSVQDSRAGIYTAEVYRQDYPFAGFPASVTTFQSNGTKINTVANTPAAKFFGLSLGQTAFPYVASSVLDSYEVGGTSNGLLITRRTMTTTLDDYGNPINVATETEDKDAASTRVGSKYSLTAVNTITNDTGTNWCLGLPTRTTVTDTLGVTSRTRTSGATIDYATCRPTQTVIEPDSDPLKVITDVTYDVAGCGNPTEVKVRGFSSNSVEMAPRITSFSYGARCQFAETITDPLGQQTQLAYRYDLGAVSSVRDPNSILTSFDYDSFGRPKRQMGADGVATEFAYSACNAANNFCGDSTLRARIDTTVRDTSGGAIRSSVAFLDSLERYRLGGRQLASGVFSNVAVTYDALGRVKTQTVPYTSTLNGSTEIDYDLLGRKTAVRLRDASNVILRQTSLAYIGREVTLTDPKGNLTRRVFDVIGNLRSVADPTPNGTMTYDYQYMTGGVLQLTVTDPLSNVTISEANRRGFTTRSVDPDLGTRAFVFNSLGELTSQTDARSLFTSITYDLLGRPLTRSEPEAMTTWTWGKLQDNTATEKYVGRLKSVVGPEYSESYIYDSLGRLKSATATTPEGQYQVDNAYHATTGQLDTLTYPVSTAGYRLRVKFDYQYGIQVRAKDANAPTAVFWQLNAMNAAGQFTDEQMGADGFAGKVRTQSNYDPTTGLINTRQSGTQGSLTNRQNLTYSWDANGNLERRSDLNQTGLYESFAYDTLDRLTSSTRNGTTNLTVDYNSLGNITNKLGVGAYTYTSPKPHAVTQAGTNTYTYDASGNMITRNGSSITWNTASLPTVINHTSGRYSEFSYTPDRQRWRQKASYAGGIETTIYIGGLLEKLTTTGGAVYYRHYIPAGSGTVLYTRASTGTTQTYFITSDHLGSSSSITDSSGALIVNESFDAFGKRRGSNWMGTPSAADLTAIANATRQGYTGQEHLDNIDLIHMNGRVQDPLIGRFLSADPLIQAPDNSQSFNRYSYVFNNPLKFTDPSGFRAESPDDIRPDAPRQSFSFGITFGELGSLGSFVQFIRAFAPLEPDVSGGAQVDTASQLRDRRRSPTAPARPLSVLTGVPPGLFPDPAVPMPDDFAIRAGGFTYTAKFEFKFGIPFVASGAFAFGTGASFINIFTGEGEVDFGLVGSVSKPFDSNDNAQRGLGVFLQLLKAGKFVQAAKALDPTKLISVAAVAGFAEGSLREQRGLSADIAAQVPITSGPNILAILLGPSAGIGASFDPETDSLKGIELLYGKGINFGGNLTITGVLSERDALELDLRLLKRLRDSLPENPEATAP